MFTRIWLLVACIGLSFSQTDTSLDVYDFVFRCLVEYSDKLFEALNQDFTTKEQIYEECNLYTEFQGCLSQKSGDSYIQMFIAGLGRAMDFCQCLDELSEYQESQGGNMGSARAEECEIFANQASCLQEHIEINPFVNNLIADLDKVMDSEYCEPIVTEEPIPVTEQGVTTSEEPISTSEEPIPMTEEPISTSEEPIPMTEEPISTSEEPIPTSEEPIPMTEEPISTSEEPIPMTEEPISTSEEPIPMTEEPIPKTKEPIPMTEEPIPKTEEPLPDTEPPVPTEDPSSTSSIPFTRTDVPPSGTPAEVFDDIAHSCDLIDHPKSPACAGWLYRNYHVMNGGWRPCSAIISGGYGKQCGYWWAKCKRGKKNKHCCVSAHCYGIGGK